MNRIFHNQSRKKYSIQRLLLCAFVGITAHYCFEGAQVAQRKLPGQIAIIFPCLVRSQQAAQQGTVEQGGKLETFGGFLSYSKCAVIGSL